MDVGYRAPKGTVVHGRKDCGRLSRTPRGQVTEVEIPWVPGDWEATVSALRALGLTPCARCSHLLLPWPPPAMKAELGIAAELEEEGLLAVAEMSHLWLLCPQCGEQIGSAVQERLNLRDILLTLEMERPLSYLECPACGREVGKLVTEMLQARARLVSGVSGGLEGGIEFFVQAMNAASAAILRALEQATRYTGRGERERNLKTTLLHLGWWGEKLTLREIGAEGVFGLSPERVRTIIAAVLRWLRHPVRSRPFRRAWTIPPIERVTELQIELAQSRAENAGLRGKLQDLTGELERQEAILLKQNLPPREMTIAELGLSTRAHYALRRAGHRWVRELCVHTSEELLGVRNFGDVGLAELRSALAEHGYHLKGEEPEAG